MRIKKESVITYLFITLLIGLVIGSLYFFNVRFTGLAVYEDIGGGQTTLMLQEAGIENLGDAYVSDVLQGKRNYGISSDLEVERSSDQRTYIKFNISAVPENQIINDSQLCLYLYNDQGSQTINVNYVYVHDWNEGSEDGTDVSGQNYTTNITWNNQPCGVDFDNSSACNLIAESSLSNDGSQDGIWQCWDVTNAVSSEYISGDKNVSLILSTSDLGNPDIFYSKEYTTDTSLRPYLNITYSSAGPSVLIISPQESENFNYNTSLPLNFTIVNSSALDTCWYNLNNGENITISCYENTTFDIGDGEYELNLYVNDSLGDIGRDSVNFSVYATGVFVIIFEPDGEKSSRTEIPIQFNAFGNNLTCWYNVKTSIWGNIIENTTLENCSNSNFDVSADGNYIFNLYANNSLGAFDSATSSFSVESGGTVVVYSGGGGGGGSSILTKITKLTVGEIQNLIVNPKDVKRISWTVKNTGTNFLNDCKFKSIGEFFSWIDYTETKNLAAGEEYEFIFDLYVPKTIGSGVYDFGVALECQEITKSVNFSVEVIEKKLNFDLIKVERIAKEKVKIIYSLEELSGLEQDVELQFLLFGPNNEKAAEVKENEIISANSKEEFEILIPIDSSLEGELNLLINLNSETYSTFVQESIILGAPISGLAIFGESGKTDIFVSIIIIILFLVFAFFIVRRIVKLRKKKR